MAGGDTAGEVPTELAAHLAQRDTSPLPEGALLRFQHIGLAPDIASNFRFVLFEDGRMLSGVNTAEPPPEDGPLFNVALSDEPVTVVPEDAMAQVRALLASQFADAPPYAGNERTRDGAVVIVTARIGGEIREAWYRNTATELTDYLWALHDEATQEPLDLDALLADLTRGKDDA